MSLLGEFKIPGPESDVLPGVSLLGEFKIPGPESDVPPGVSLLGEFKIPGPESDVPYLGSSKSSNPKVMFLYLGNSKSSKSWFPNVMFLHLGNSKNSISWVPNVMFLYLESSNNSKFQKSRVPKVMFLYTDGEFKQFKCRFFLRSWRACRWPAWLGFPREGPERTRLFVGYEVLWARSANRTGSMDGLESHLPYPTAIRRLSDGYPTAIRRLSDGYPTLSDGIRRRALVDPQFWGPRPNYPTVIRRLSDGHPTAIRRLSDGPSDGYPTVIRW